MKNVAKKTRKSNQCWCWIIIIALFYNKDIAALTNKTSNKQKINQLLQVNKFTTKNFTYFNVSK